MGGCCSSSSDGGYQDMSARPAEPQSQGITGAEQPQQQGHQDANQSAAGALPVLPPIAGTTGSDAAATVTEPSEPVASSALVQQPAPLSFIPDSPPPLLAVEAEAQAKAHRDDAAVPGAGPGPDVGARGSGSSSNASS